MFTRDIAANREKKTNTILVRRLSLREIQSGFLGDSFDLYKLKNFNLYEKKTITVNVKKQ